MLALAGNIDPLLGDSEVSSMYSIVSTIVEELRSIGEEVRVTAPF